MGDIDPTQDSINAALFADAADHSFVERCFVRLKAERHFAVSDTNRFLRRAKVSLRLSSDELGLDREQITAETVLSALRRWLGDAPANSCLHVDMNAAATRVQGAAHLQAWGAVAEKIAQQMGLRVVSHYNRDLLIGDQVQAAFRAHRQFLAPSGLHLNPYWIPPDLRLASQGEQLSFLLGRVVPDYADKGFFDRDSRFDAHGAEPDWLARPRRMRLAPHEREAWKIYCLGQLRVYRNDGARIEWKIKGGAPKKTRALFAYLLTKGEKGAHVDRLAEFLWPESDPETSKRTRLHHTVAMLRKTLGDKTSVVRAGEYYRLNTPEDSWIDIASFEQLCRRGLALDKRGQKDEALLIYRTAEQMYSGDLFQDIPMEYVDGEGEDWCMPRRTWLRDMWLKLQRNMSALLRENGKLREALEHCQKALAADPVNEDANIETMRVFHAQGRIDAVARQFKQYRAAMHSIDATPEGSEVQALFLALTVR